MTAQLVAAGTDVDADTVNVLQRIYEQHGELTAELVVDEARKPASPLHERFEWNDMRAAEQYRLEQARRLVRSVHIVIEQRPVRAFPFIPQSGSYRPIADVLTNVDWRQQMLDEFKRDAQRFERKWADHKFVAEHYRLWLEEQVTS